MTLFYSAHQKVDDNVATWDCRLEDLLYRAKKEQYLSEEATRCTCISLAGRYRSHAPERCIFLNYIFGSPKGSIYQIFMFPARNIFSMVFLAAILAAILDFQRPSWIYINQHNFKTNYHRETNDTNFSWYFDTINPFAMLFLGFGQHFLGNGCHGDKNTGNFEKCLYTFNS